jgi:hypothetical protein
MDLRRREVVLVLSLCLCVAATAQVLVHPVQWTGAAVQKTAARPRMKIAIELSAEVQEGRHVYGLTQLPGGPTPLRVTLDANEVCQIAGATSGTVPVEKHDAAFDLDTKAYGRSFRLRLPVEINPHPASGRNPVPVSVRFRACNDRVCLPPRKVHISASSAELVGRFWFGGVTQGCDIGPFP